MNCVTDRLDTRFRFIYAVAVVHMLVEDADRMGFYTFIREHLEPDGIALISTMGDGSFECRSDIRTAFDLQERIHEESGKTLCIAGTSYRAVSLDTFTEELERADLAILKLGTTRVDPDYAVMMYAVVKGK